MNESQIAAIAKERADWLVDAIATATQNRAILRGDSQEDKVLTKAIFLNAEKAIKIAIQKALK